MAVSRYERDRQRWFKQASQGQARYVLKVGVLAWGVPMFVIMTILIPWFQHGLDKALEYQNLVTGVVIWSIGGAGFGWWLWRSCVKKFGVTPPTE